MQSPSSIAIEIDGDDVTQKVVFAESSFQSQANAIPGDYQIIVKDSDHTFSVQDGARISLTIDGSNLFGGYVKRKGRNHFFPVVDSTNPETVDRRWVVRGPDYNALFDRRVLRNPDNYFGPLTEPGGTIAAMVKRLYDRFVDVPSGLDYETYVDHQGDYPAGLYNGQGTYLRDQMDDFAQFGGAVYYIDGGFNLHFHAYEDVVSPWGFTDWRGRIDGDKWIGFREGDYDEDGMQMVTDALVWGGSALSKGRASGDAIGTVFARYPDPPASTYKIPGYNAWRSRLDGPMSPSDDTIRVTTITDMPDPYFDIEIDDEKMVVTKVNGHVLTVSRTPPYASHDDRARVICHRNPPVILTAKKEQEAIERQAQYGIWQRAEVRPGQPMYLLQESVNLRAYTIVAGNPGIDPATGIDGGLNRPLPTVKVSWFAHDVPFGQHLVPGMLVPFIFYTMGTDIDHPLSVTLPLRSVRITFPTIPSNNPDHESLTYVRFDGEFGISETDSRFLWRFLSNLRKKRAQSQRTWTEVADDSSTAAIQGSEGRFTFQQSPDGELTDFSIQFGYYSGTTQVYINGLLQRPGIEYQEIDPGAGLIRFEQAPYADDTLYMVCKVNSHA